MKLTVTLERENSTQNIEFKGTKVQDLLDFLKLSSEEVLIVRNSEVLTEDEMLSEDDLIEVLNVVSGG
ncbi:MAG TPA: MoaD/ThiS family protein [Candidatus Nanoarchaeia archaeon]|nr:MoaD/ThiS family protein [Candidatus Nanoarchaeia archaeon]